MQHLCMSSLGKHAAVLLPFSTGLTTYVVLKCVVIDTCSVEKKAGCCPTDLQGDVMTYPPVFVM